MKISLIILTRNEIMGSQIIIPQIPRTTIDEVICIDGGSTDGTIEFMRENNITVFVQDKRGRGEAFRLAFQVASGDALIFFSPDGNEDPNDIPKFRPLLETGSDLVIATRMLRGAHNEEDEKIFRWRKWANLGFNFFANQTWNKGARISDSINGFRAITRSAWSALKLDGPGYTIEYQSSIRAMKLGLNISEFCTHEAERLDGREGSPSVSTGLAFIRMYFSELHRSNNF